MVANDHSDRYSYANRHTDFLGDTDADPDIDTDCDNSGNIDIHDHPDRFGHAN